MQQNENFAGGYGSGASPVAGQAKEIARTGTQQVKELGQSARERAMREANSRRESFAGEIDKLAGTLDKQRGQSEGAGPVLDFAANGARRLSAMLRDHTAEELLERTRHSPVALLAGTFALGFFAARLFRT